ncbi:hypothetical protein [Streptomyces avermitilis]|uniref:hypothetical protein n=1 Tax=Streptomyces avermitilis TaxID=33903 RepID=UPI00368D89FE
MDRQHTPDPRPRLSDAHRRESDPRPGMSTPLLSERPQRISLPVELPAGLGYDAVGTSPEHGERIMECLPRIGCVFGDDLRWWWIVPSGSHVGVTWPSCTTYAIGAYLADPSWTRASGRPRPGGPRLIHRPDGNSPYTPPIPLYFLICRLAGISPSWSLGAVS